MQTAGYSLITLFFGGVLILSIGSSTKWLPSLCTWDFLIFFGKYSYGLYVFHNLVEPLFQTELFPRPELAALTGSRLLGGFMYMAVASGASVLIAYVSWHAYEKHFLKLKGRFSSVAKHG